MPEETASNISAPNPEQEPEQEKAGEFEGEAGPTNATVSFPWLILFAALICDAIEFFFPPSAIVFYITFCWWQKRYVQQWELTNIFINAGLTKIFDLVIVGVLPSNFFLVFRAYLKRRVIETIKHPIGHSAQQLTAQET